MQVDLDQTAPQHAPSQIFRSTVCIIGGGIAGLTLAIRLAEAGIGVHLLEAGGLDYEQRSQDLYNVEMAQEKHRGSTEGRFRNFGGSSTRWGGQLLPFTPDIFDPPPGSPSLGWPIRESDISPYYDQVQKNLGVDSLPFTADLVPALGFSPLSTSSDIVARFAKWAPFDKRNMANTLGAKALAHPLITVFLHANAASLHTGADDRASVERVQVLNYAKALFTFTANYFVVAAGTIECSRLLLNSPDVPDPYDQTGRWFHDHVSFHAALFPREAHARIVELLGPFYVEKTLHSCKLEASPQLRASHGMYAVMAHITILEPEDSGTGAVRNLLRSVQQGNFGQALKHNVLPMVLGLGDVARLLWYSRFKKRRSISKRAVTRLNIDIEQCPHPDNRISVARLDPDALGIPRAVMQWSVHDEERDTALRFLPYARDCLKSMGLEPAEWDDTVSQNLLPHMLDTNHAMGGLRMGFSPESSVVDTNLAVHGMSNLYVASCAVFPSGGSSNPTFTMMALTLRLADHLLQKLKSS